MANKPNLEERHPTGEPQGSDGVTPQIDPSVILEVLNSIQSYMDGIEARLEKPSDDPLFSTFVVCAPAAPQVPTQPLRHRERPVQKMKITEFLKLKLLTFVGDDPTDEPQRFLDESEKILSALECFDS